MARVKRISGILNGVPEHLTSPADRIRHRLPLISTIQSTVAENHYNPH
jgi:hypothetical protein